MTHKKSSRLVNWLGALSYCALLLQWAWLIVTLLPWFLAIDSIQYLPAEPKDVFRPEPIPILSPLISAVVLVVMIGLTVFFVWRLPKVVVRESVHIVHRTRDVVLPKVATKHHATKRDRMIISGRLLLGLKLGLAFVPYLALYATILTKPPLDEQIVLDVGLFLMVWSLAYISFQRLLAHVQHVDYTMTL